MVTNFQIFQNILEVMFWILKSIPIQLYYPWIGQKLELIVSNNSRHFFQYQKNHS